MQKENYSFIAIADMHLGCKLYNLPELEEDMKLLFVDICQLAITKKVNYILMAGDLFNSNRPTPDLVKFVADNVARLKEHGIRFLGICGDHDLPVNNETWVSVTGIESLSSAPYFAGANYSTNQVEVFDRIREQASETVHWILAHGQVQQLFKYVEDKKKLDFDSLKVFELFPNIKGIILGDIHNPIETVVKSGDREAYMGYCGSAGITKSDEASNKKGLLYFDGETLQRIPLLQKRDFIKIQFTGIEANLNTQFYSLKYKDTKKKPVFIVEYDTTTESHLNQLKPLYEVGFVRAIQKRKMEEGQTEETINIRSELKTGERIETVLRKCAKNQVIFDLGLKLLTSEDSNDAYKTELDTFKRKSFQ